MVIKEYTPFPNNGSISASSNTKQLDKKVNIVYNKHEVITSIEVVIKALGTMIIIPTFLPNNDIGAVKQQGQPLQQGILQNADRLIAEAKLMELINKL